MTDHTVSGRHSAPTLDGWEKGFRAGEDLLIGTLSSDLYDDRGACLRELYKNACCACMDDTAWQPERVHIELDLVQRHPLAPTCTSLTAMDRGHGFRPADVERFSVISGNRNSRKEKRHGGASQKQIGRMAYFSLNERLLNRTDVGVGFYILTRTESTGKVSLVTITPETGKAFACELISDTDARMGAYKGMKGSFTIIVIPNSVYKTLEDISQDLVWHLPRLSNRAIDVRVGKHKLVAPPLPRLSTDVKYDGKKIVAHLEPSDEDGEGGIWLTDAATGLRCARCPSMSRNIPYPLNQDRLRGDIFIHGLLENQRTDRAGLKRELLESTWWEGLVNTLTLHIARFALNVLGESDALNHGDPGHQRIISLLNRLEEVFGPPVKDAPPHRPPRKPPGTTGPKEENEEDGPDGGSKDPPRRPLGTRQMINGKPYTILPQSLADPNTFATASHSVLLLNKNYRNAPRNPPAAVEHALLLVFVTIAHWESSGDPIAFHTMLNEMVRATKEADRRAPKPGTPRRK